MTIDQFIDKLSTVRDLHWFLDSGVLRGGVPETKMVDDFYGRCYCPVVCFFREYHNGVFATAGRRLGLSYPDTRAIVSAADMTEGHDPVLRQRLLAAVGLAE